MITPKVNKKLREKNINKLLKLFIDKKSDYLWQVE